jgi:hypothetical protein
MLIIAVATYLVIVGGNMDKTPEEQRLEDEEQIKYIRNYCNERNKSEKSKTKI